MTPIRIYARTTVDEGRPTERTFRVVRYPDRGGWAVEVGTGGGKPEKVGTRYTLAMAIRLMDELANEERTRLASTGRGESAAHRAGSPVMTRARELSGQGIAMTSTPLNT